MRAGRLCLPQVSISSVTCSIVQSTRPRGAQAPRGLFLFFIPYAAPLTREQANTHAPPTVVPSAVCQPRYTFRDLKQRRSAAATLPATTTLHRFSPLSGNGFSATAPIKQSPHPQQNVATEHRNRPDRGCKRGPQQPRKGHRCSLVPEWHAGKPLAFAWTS